LLFVYVKPQTVDYLTNDFYGILILVFHLSFCSQHDVVCCRVCLPEGHRTCENVLPLDFVSKDIINSSLLSDTLKELDHMTEKLEKLVSPQNFSSQSVQYFMALEFLPSSVHGSQKLGVAMVNLYKKKESDNVS
jgi:hypothetical protein